MIPASPETGYARLSRLQARAVLAALIVVALGIMIYETRNIVVRLRERRFSY